MVFVDYHIPGIIKCGFQTGNNFFRVVLFDCYYLINTQFGLSLHTEASYCGTTFADRTNLLPK